MVVLSSREPPGRRDRSSRRWDGVIQDLGCDTKNKKGSLCTYVRLTSSRRTLESGVILCGSEAQYRGHVEFYVTFLESAERLLLPLSPWSWSIIIVVCKALHHGS
jgi:hypothetical protein